MLQFRLEAYWKFIIFYFQDQTWWLNKSIELFIGHCRLYLKRGVMTWPGIEQRQQWHQKPVKEPCVYGKF